MKKLQAIEQALKEGAVLKGFRSGGGLRVVSVHAGQKCLGYGEHPHIGDALEHANQDILDGHIGYQAQYSGKDAKYQHYLTGSSSPSSLLDSWILRGKDLAIQYEGAEFVTTLSGLEETRVPKEVNDYVLLTGLPLFWSSVRGYTFESSPVFRVGSSGVGTKCLASPKGEDEPWMYSITKIGKGGSLEESIADVMIVIEKELQHNG